MTALPDLDSITKVHFVGIKGVGMTALARLVFDMDKIVCGSDIAVDSITNSALAEVGIKLFDHFDLANITSEISLVVYTGAHNGSENIEVKTAQTQGIPVMNYGRALAFFLSQKKVIAISGTHGKTTTSAMLATILKTAQLDPSWIVGTGEIISLGSPGHYGQGQWAVVEADEYFDEPNGKPKFLHLNPYGLVITSLDWDHPDVYKTPKHFMNAFHKLIKRVDPKGKLVLIGNNPYLRKVVKSVKPKVRWVLPNQIWHNLKLVIPGEFNRIDATFAATMAHELGVKQSDILKGLSQFKGVERRLENKGEKFGWLVIDDYAHHPTEIKMALAAVREKYPEAWITVAFQSHTFSRTKAFLKDFVNSFGLADYILIAPVFASARETRPADFIDLAQSMPVQNNNFAIINSPSDLQSYLKSFDLKVDQKILITMGAGDIYQWIK